MSDLFSVAGKVVVVTGGLGQLGREFTTALAKAGAKVAVFSRRPVTQETFDTLFPGLGETVRIYEASVTDKAALEAATEKVIADWGVPDVLVNNAGIDSKPDGGAEQNAPFEVYPQKFWDEIIDVNLTGVML